ncbi:DUF4197 domain-containing protein [Pontibacter silvestris]|uniref:DUF4197 domain-containing protein n=1 Tax=Pontibacter silvestris TaxID=2305183 RepID=A0ABW4X2X5_9BACT|nr:DUF4197 domain-containing protein [Pontibacter silvestris]MCC9136096.1 DUF4197 domain-containing protein [Pontibacter silvestris]
MRSTRLVLLTFSILLLSQLQAYSQISSIISKVSNPSSSEIGLGIKEALEKGVSAGTDRLSVANGFLGNPSVKILFPSEAQKMEKTLRGLGLNQLCDNVILSLNRAAEDAAQEAKPIFVSAIEQMSLSEASNILLGKETDAATNYFKSATSDQLREKFKPIIQTSLDKANATTYWGEATNAYNKVPLVKKVDPDLTNYVTQKAIDGLFVEIAKEELKIRQDASARTSPLLQKVFGYADKNN